MSDLPSLDQAPYWVVAAYALTPIADPAVEAERLRAACRNWDVRCRIYIAEEGLNLQLSVAAEDGPALQSWFASDPLYHAMPLKLQGARQHVFPRTTIKVRRQLVAVDRAVDLTKRGQHIDPETWCAQLESDQPPVVLDVRNRYEWEVGHFQGALPCPYDSFREFPRWAAELREQLPKDQPILMCCTGGIRCEFFSSLLMEEGFENVQQLEGGMIAYSERCADRAWEGSLFVFDDRLTVPMGGEAPAVGSCHHCGSKTDRYLNCANMDCNELFLCCPNCLEGSQGCCSKACTCAPRLRQLQQPDPYRPFARAHLDVCLVQQPSSEICSPAS